jgi:hypothetical protein
MICYGIYPLSEKRQMFLYLISGLGGLTVTIIALCEMVFGEKSFIENKMLSDTGTSVMFGCLLFAIFLAYAIKKIYNKKTGGFEK